MWIVSKNLRKKTFYAYPFSATSPPAKANAASSVCILCSTFCQCCELSLFSSTPQSSKSPLSFYNGKKNIKKSFLIKISDNIKILRAKAFTPLLLYHLQAITNIIGKAFIQTDCYKRWCCNGFNQNSTGNNCVCYPKSEDI